MRASGIYVIPLSLVHFNDSFKFVLGFDLKKMCQSYSRTKKNNAIIMMHHIFIFVYSNCSSEAKYESLYRKTLKLPSTIMNKNDLCLCVEI